MKDIRLVIRIEKDIDEFIKNKMSKNISKTENLVLLLRLGVEVFDVIDEIRKLKRRRKMKELAIENQFKIIVLFYHQR